MAVAGDAQEAPHAGGARGCGPLPLGWKGRLPRWAPPGREEAGLDAEQMVRSCLTWDERAAEYGRHISSYLQREWLEKVAERAADARDPVTKMADMAWRLEDQMNQMAQAL